MPTVLTNSDVSFTSNFKLNVTPKKLELTDTVTYSDFGVNNNQVKGVIKVVAPSGTTVYNNTDFNSPDIDRGSSAVNTTTISLPLSGTMPEAGEYEITYTIQVTDGVNPVYTVYKASTYTYEYERPTVSISQTVDCISPSFVSEDDTDYTVEGITPTITRTHTLTYPVGSGASATSSSNATITVSTFYNGTQTTSISSILSYTFSDGLIVTDTVTGYKEVVVDCEDWCDIFCCIKAIYDNKEAAKSTNLTKYREYSALFNDIMADLTLAFKARECGQEFSDILDTIRTKANCTDECSCSDGETPTQVTGLSASGVTVVVESGGSPVVVTAVTAGDEKTYKISLSSAFVTKVNNSYNSVVAAGSGVSLATATAADGTKTYTVTASNNPNLQSFQCTLLYENYAAPTVTITEAEFEKYGTNLGTNSASVTSVGYGTDVLWADKNNLFTVTGFQVSNNDNYKVHLELTFTSDTFQPEGESASRLATQIYLMPLIYKPELVNLTSGSFQFRLVDADGLPVTNNKLVAGTYLMNILITE